MSCLSSGGAVYNFGRSVAMVGGLVGGSIAGRYGWGGWNNSITVRARSLVRAVAVAVLG